MRGAAGHGRRGRNPTTFRSLLILALARQAPVASTDSMVRLQLGDVTVVVAPAKTALGTALGEAASVPHDWLGLGRQDAGTLTLLVLPDQASLERWSRGRLPSWGAGVTFPGAHVVAVRTDGGDPFQTLRHELAHVVLHREVPGRVPLWFDEGYASLASGEYGRMAMLQLNLAVVSGRVPDFRALDADLRGNEGDAQAAYALAASAVAELARRNPTNRLDPLMSRLASGVPFEEAVRQTTGMTVDRFEEAWQQVVRRRYNWLVWLSAGGAWVVVTLLLTWAAIVRRRRDAPRRALLDEGWPSPTDDEEITTPSFTDPQLDPGDSGR